jgi:hypothetical protein
MPGVLLDRDPVVTGMGIRSVVSIDRALPTD